jgi:hypothetical protein
MQKYTRSGDQGLSQGITGVVELLNPVAMFTSLGAAAES